MQNPNPNVFEASIIVVDEIIADMVKHQSGSDHIQTMLDGMVKAREHLIIAKNTVNHHVPKYVDDCGVDEVNIDKCAGHCEKYDRCKECIEEYARFIGKWQVFQTE